MPQENDHAGWWCDYLISNNGDGTMDALHKHFEALDIKEVEFIEAGGCRVTPLDGNRFAVHTINGDELRLMATMEVGGLRAIDVDRFNLNRALA